MCIYIYVYIKYMCIYIYIYIYIFSLPTPRCELFLPLRPISLLTLWICEGLTRAEGVEFSCPYGEFPESLSQAMLVGVMLVGGLGVCTQQLMGIERQGLWRITRNILRILIPALNSNRHTIKNTHTKTREAVCA